VSEGKKRFPRLDLIKEEELATDDATAELAEPPFLPAKASRNLFSNSSVIWPVTASFWTDKVNDFTIRVRKYLVWHRHCTAFHLDIFIGEVLIQKIISRLIVIAVLHLVS
jgi:hypothetical protein